MYLFNDTETTGFPSGTRSARDPKQGRVCQAAFILADGTGRTLAEACFLIRPDGWAIGAGAHAVHGLTDALCEKYGVSSQYAFQTFAMLAGNADTYIAHNAAFDWNMLEIEAQAHGLKMPKFKDRVCTMKDTGRPTGQRSLAATYLHFTGCEIGEKAHDALVDARACRDIFFAWKGQKYNGQKADSVVIDEYADLV